MSRTRSGILLVTLLFAAGCARTDLVDPALRYGPPDGVGGGGGKVETTTGNNLSNPVIFAEAYGLTGLAVSTGALLSTGLRTPPTATYATLPDYYIDPTAPVEYLTGVGDVYCQKTGHTWMPQWGLGATNATVDWGDNLTSVQFTSTSVVRVETTLFAPGTMTGYTMYLFSGTKKTEQQCTDFTEVLLQPTVYSVAPRLQLYKVTADQAPPAAGQTPLLDLPVADGLANDGPGYYSAEVNVGGKVIYGYNLQVKQLPVADKKGWYVLDFSLDPTVLIGGVTVPRGVTLTATDPLDARAVIVNPYQTRIWFEIKDARDKGKPTG